MGLVLLYTRSLIFNTFMYAFMLVVGVVFAPAALISPKGAVAAVKFYSRTVIWVMGWLVGLKVDIRGPVPKSEVLVASKHQSFLDIILLAHALPNPKFVMKKELKYMPILGFYAMRMGCAPVDRGKRGATVEKMVKDLSANAGEAAQTIIYPQGTRVAPGVTAPYKVGAGVIYDRFGLDCVPAATNAGVFWGRNTVARHKGTAVIEFLPVIPKGRRLRSFLTTLEEEVEAASDRLLDEARAAKRG